MYNTPFGSAQDSLFMQEALCQAQLAAHAHEVPIGSVVVNAVGAIVGRGYNCVERIHSQRGHAEFTAIEQATSMLGDWRLTDHWLFVTLEPCSMCMAFVRLSRLKGVVYGASSPLFGFQLDNAPASWVYNNGTPIIIAGVEKEASILLLKNFFKEKRSRGSV